MVEFGAAIQHGWQDGHGQTLIGPALKLGLRSPSRGVGLGLGLSAVFDASSGRAESAAVLVPATIDLTPHVRANVNLGYQWARTGNRHALFVGAQVEARVREGVSIIAEGFVRDHGAPGFQTGLRWTPRPWIDVDLLGGDRIDVSAGTAITIGLTIRG